MKPTKWQILYFLVFICFYGELKAQQQDIKFHFNHISSEQGLSNSSVYTILQDNQGYLWFGTADGLNKYDGNRFTVFKHQPFNANSLSNNWITALAVDKYYNLWIGTYGGGLDMLNTRTMQFENFSVESERVLHINHNLIRTLYYDKNDILWIGTDAGLNAYDAQNKRLMSIGIDSSEIGKIVRNESVNAIILRDSLLYLGMWGDGLIRLNLNNKQLTRVFFHKHDKDRNNFNQIKSIVPAGPNSLFIATRGGGVFELSETDLSVVRQFTSENSTLSHNMIYSMVDYGDDLLWIGTFYNGLNLLNKKTNNITNFFASKFEKNSVSGNWIPGLFIDRTNVLWVGTDKGVSYLPLQGAGFRHYSINSSNLNLEFEANINALFEDQNGDIWVGTWGHGLIKYDIKSKTYQQFMPKMNQNSIQSERVWAVLQDKNGMLWIGTAASLDLFDPIKNQFYHYSCYVDENGYGKIPANNISSLCFMGDTSLLVGTWGGGLSAIDIRTRKVIGFDNSMIKGSRIKSLYVDKDKKLWIGSSSEGISIYNTTENSWQYLVNEAENKKSLSANDIEGFAEDETSIWVATNNSGLNKINKRSLNIDHYFLEDGLASNSLRRIVVDKTGNLWISSQNGISRLNPQTEEIRNFDQTDGLQGNEFTRGYLMLKNGEIAFGGNNGFNVFEPNSLIINKTLPKIVISRFYKFNQELNLYNELDAAGQLVLRTSDNMVSFEFRALDFNAPQKNQYLYKLEGFDKNWRKPLSEPIATYTNLPAGKYIFRVIASNNHGFWNTDGISLKVRVYPPIYLTWQFFVALFLVGIVLSVAFLKKRELYLRMAAARLERLINEKTEEIRLKNEILEDQNAEIVQQRDEIELQKQEALAQRDDIQKHRDLVQEQKEQLTDSILYAQTIQMAMMPDQRALNAFLQKSFLLFLPKDIVSGDFVWLKELNNLKYIAVADCTGHGVPGGFMSMFGISILNELVLHENMRSASEILESLRTRLIQTAAYKKDKYSNHDGIDIAMCIYDEKNAMIRFSGAHIPLYLIRKNEIHEFAADKMSVGPYVKYQAFTEQSFPVVKGDKVYLFTDGYSDQFGGNHDRKFMKSNLKQLILDMHQSDMLEQEVIFANRMKTWRGILEQVDDITGLGFMIV